jgi:hypothetical protein
MSEEEAPSMPPYPSAFQALTKNDEKEHFQPSFCLSSSSLVGDEALLQQTCAPPADEEEFLYLQRSKYPAKIYYPKFLLKQ